ncbi:MAG TPA: hypothetical protein VJ932_05720 [Alkalispirochaeta sp.]|nr:hypothetical protein [Alkalispirochaeta sp.]
MRRVLNRGCIAEPCGFNLRSLIPRYPLVRAVALLGMMVTLSAPVAAQTPAPPAPFEGEITMEVWAIEDRIIHPDAGAEERLLREAQFVLSGMIYGWDFVYTPEYAARGVERFFELEPVGAIAWGDPRLRLRDLRDSRNRDSSIHGQIDFALSESDIRRLEAWRAMDTERSGGVGSAPLLEGLPGKFVAMEEAIHQAIRDYLRGTTFNRPREVVGSVVLDRPPRVRTVSGTYEAQVRVLIRIDEVVQYQVF